MRCTPQQSEALRPVLYVFHSWWHMKTMTDFPAPRMVQAGDVTFATYETGPKDGRPVLLLHGWPELAFSWSQIMPALAEAGYRAIAIDQKGFGQSAKPDDARLYGMDILTADFARLIEALGYDRILLCGHDWGGAMVWPMAYTYPALIEGVIGICTPHRKRAPAPPIEIYRTKFSPDHYIVTFQDLDAPDRVFGGHEERMFRFMFRGSPPRSVWPKLFPALYDQIGRFEEFKGFEDSQLIISPDVLKHFAETYAASGHRTPTHIYRNVDHNWRLTEGVDLTVHQPVLMFPAELDIMLPPESADQMPALCPDLTMHLLRDCGHWAMWEKPAEINRVMTTWLQQRFPA